jgi:hypothetical protein
MGGGLNTASHASFYGSSDESDTDRLEKTGSTVSDRLSAILRTLLRLPAGRCFGKTSPYVCGDTPALFRATLPDGSHGGVRYRGALVSTIRDRIGPPRSDRVRYVLLSCQVRRDRFHIPRCVSRGRDSRCRPASATTQVSASDPSAVYPKQTFSGKTLFSQVRALFHRQTPFHFRVKATLIIYAFDHYGQCQNAPNSYFQPMSLSPVHPMTCD